MARHEVETHQVWVALGVGKGLGKIKNKRVLWRRLKAMLSEPMVDTSITFTQYLKLVAKSKSADKVKAKAANDRLLEAKRLPGNWTAARYEGAVRKVGDVKGKSCVVLDLDYVSHEQLDWIKDGFAEINDFAWFMHTSRSHTPEKPRVRLVVPCSRFMTPEEAFAIHRLLSLYLATDPEEAIEIPDLVSFRTNQTMFKPSISQGQEFWTAEHDAPVFNVDDFLEVHPEWTDFESLPYQERENERGLKDPNSKMEDPRTKPNPIGAFCRAFTVEDVIERFIPEVYIPSDSETETRYTYVAGSGNSGAVAYDDGLFIHSNHGTDPIEGTANAWDLARIHLFGDRDNEAHGNTTPFNMPSHKAMVEFARGLPEVAAEEFSFNDDLMDDLEDDEGEESTGGHDAPGVSSDDEVDDKARDHLGDELDDLDEDEDEESTRSKKKKKKADSEWLTHLRRKQSGDLEPVLNNAVLICENDPRIKGCIGYNEFTHDPVCFKPIRSKSITTASSVVHRRDRKRGRRWEDGDDYSINLISTANKQRSGYETDFADNTIQKAVLAVGRQNPVNPVKDDILECWEKWKAEGSPCGGLDTYVIRHLKTPDTIFHRESAAMYLIASVVRTFEPGAKFDVMPVIEGKTGSGKSTFYIVLFQEEFTTELKVDLHDTGRLIEQTRGYRCIEMAEMVHAKKADANTLKMQLSSARDVHRMAYGKREHEFPRQFVFGGTSNDDDYLTDPTSTRRFWVWRTGLDMENRLGRDALQDERALLWGEAYQRYLNMRQVQPFGPLFLDVDGEAARERDVVAQGSRKRTVVEEIADVIEEWLAKPERACDVMLDEEGMTLPEFEGDESLVVRNMTHAAEVYAAVRHEEVLAPYRNIDSRTFGKALSLVPGWVKVSDSGSGRVRRHGKQSVWFFLHEDGALWVPAVGGQAGDLDLEDDDFDALLD